MVGRQIYVPHSRWLPMATADGSPTRPRQTGVATLSYFPNMAATAPDNAAVAAATTSAVNYKHL